MWLLIVGQLAKVPRSSPCVLFSQYYDEGRVDVKDLGVVGRVVAPTELTLSVPMWDDSEFFRMVSDEDSCLSCASAVSSLELDSCDVKMRIEVGELLESGGGSECVKPQYMS